ncbi:hypothetical protein BJ742DRAFT_207591 [Cladochytrium replicatum]|nr:hypothetical protein BJ742DRAFT_207591 [Cladochytrium replicatum]
MLVPTWVGEHQCDVVLEPLNDTFVTKRLELYEPVKIGRKVNVKTGPEPTNGVFDSKVLSRNHAEIWQENGQVFIRDVKSSNGTFVNGNRLSEEGQPSSPYELHSGDEIEFGIDILNDDNVTILFKKVACKLTIDGTGNISPSAPATESEPSRSIAVVNASVLNTQSSRDLKKGPPAVNTGKLREAFGIIDVESKRAQDTRSQLDVLKASLNELRSVPTRKPAPTRQQHQEELAAAIQEQQKAAAAAASAAADAAAGQAAMEIAKHQLEEARSESQAWREKYLSLLPIAKDHEELTKKKQMLEMEKEKLAGDLQDALDAKTSAFGEIKEIVENLVSAEESMKRKLEEKTLLALESETHLKNLQTQLDDMETELTALRAQHGIELTASRAEVSSIRDESSKAEKELKAKLTELADTTAREIERLQKELTIALSAAESETSRRMKAEETISQFEEDVARWKKAADAANDVLAKKDAELLRLQEVERMKIERAANDEDGLRRRKVPSSEADVSEASSPVEPKPKTAAGKSISSALLSLLCISSAVLGAVATYALIVTGSGMETVVMASSSGGASS